MSDYKSKSLTLQENEIQALEFGNSFLSRSAIASLSAFIDNNIIIDTSTTASELYGSQTSHTNYSPVQEWFR